MTPFLHKPILLILIFSLLSYGSSSQNLVPNPGFETYNFCPVSLGSAGDPLPDIPWFNGNMGTSDYYNACSNGEPDVPNNTFGFQFAHAGNAYMGQYTSNAFNDYREYIQVQLLSTLVAGQNYYVSFYVSLADNGCGSEHIGAYFSEYAPPYVFSHAIIVEPQVDANFGFLTDAISWTLVSGCFVAQGDEEWLTIGNFHALAESPIDPNCTLTPWSYFYIDDVYVAAQAPEEEYVFDLGPPVYLCDDYVIDPGLTDVHYLWEDGSTDPTLHVTTSGTYSLTVSQNCSVGVDSLEVNIGGQSDVQLGPDEITICDGDTYVISLDPAWNYSWNDGSTDSDYSVTTSGTYQVTMDDGCSITEDEITVTVLSPPGPFSLGEDVLICPDDEVTFDLSPDLGLFQWQDGNSSSDYSISISGNYSLTISNVCGAESDDLQVTVVEPPFLELEDNYLLCAGNTLDFSLDPAIGDIEWQDGADGADYVIATGGYFSVTVSNMCGTAVEDFFVDFWSIPLLDLPDSLSVCSGQFPITLDASHSLNATQFLWEDGSQDSTLLVNTQGTYTITISNVCFSLQDSVVVNADADAPIVALPADQLLCPGQTFVITNTGDPGNYLWQDNSTADSLLVTSPGTYMLTISTLCGSGSDTVVINYLSPLAIPDLGPDLSLCPGEQIVLSPNISIASFLWQDLSTADTLLINAAGTYYVQASNQCTSLTDTIEVSLNNNPPQVDFPLQLDLCQGDTIILDAVVSGVSYLWNDNSQSSTLSVTSPGSYSITVSNACGTDTETVSILDAGPVPAVSLGNDVQLCPGDIITISPDYTAVSTWLWSDGSFSDSYSVSGNELVTVTVTNSCGVAFDTLAATLLPATPPLDLGNDTSLCVGNTLLLNITTPNVNIEWSDGSVNAQLQINNPGTYYATISNSCGENADTINVGILPPAPVIDLGVDQSLCPGEAITLDPGVINANYLWQDGSTSSSFSATQAGTIILSLSNSCGTDSDTLEVIESTEGPQVHLGEDVLGCEGDVITLSADISGVNYLWQDGSTSAAITTTSSGEFIVEVSNSCGTDTDTVFVNLLSAPEAFDLGPDTTLCPGESLLLLAPSTAAMIEWQDGSHGETFLAEKEQAYSLEISNDCGSTTDELILHFDHRVPVVLLDDLIAWCPGILLTLDATQLIPVTYQWSTGDHSPTIVVDKAGLYSVDIQAPCASAHDETEVILSDTCFTENSFFVPNVFSPNDDNINDIFSISLSEGIEVHSMHANIFDRWGNMVFQSIVTPIQWKGDFNGEPLNPGVYIYRIELQYLDNVVERTVVLHGDVTLVR